MLQPPRIVDIRNGKVEDQVYEAVMSGIQMDPRTLPILILYGTEGLQHWDRHSHAPDYYPRHEELHILKARAREMAQTIVEDCVLVDFGSASLDKVILLLDALEEQKKKVTYYALDLSYPELEATLRTLPLHKYQYVECAALHGTFDDGLEWIKKDPEVKDRPHCAMFLGSTIGNFSRASAAEFVQKMATSALSGRPEDSSILISIDSCKLPTKILRAYTSDGVVPFAMAGLRYVSTIVGKTSESEAPITEIFQTDDWYYLSEYNHLLGRHEAYYTPRNRAIRLGAPLDHIVVQKGEKIRFGYSHKYDEEERNVLFHNAGVAVANSWTAPGCDLAFFQVKLSSQ